MKKFVFGFFCFSILFLVNVLSGSAYFDFLGRDGVDINHAMYMRNDWGFDVPIYKVDPSEKTVGFYTGKSIRQGEIKGIAHVDLIAERAFLKNSEEGEYIPTRFFSATKRNEKKEISKFTAVTNTTARVYMARNCENNFSFNMGIYQTQDFIFKSSVVEVFGIINGYVSIKFNGSSAFLRLIDLDGTQHVAPQIQAATFGQFPANIPVPQCNDAIANMNSPFVKTDKLYEPDPSFHPGGYKGYNEVKRDVNAKNIYEKNGDLIIPSFLDSSGNEEIEIFVNQSRYYEEQQQYVDENKGYFCVVTFKLINNGNVQFAHVIFHSYVSFMNKFLVRRATTQDSLSLKQGMIKIEGLVTKKVNLDSSGEIVSSPGIWQPVSLPDDVYFGPDSVYKVNDFNTNKDESSRLSSNSHELGIHCTHSVGYLYNTLNSEFLKILEGKQRNSGEARLTILPNGNDCRSCLAWIDGAVVMAAVGANGVDTDSKDFSPVGRIDQRTSSDNTQGPAIAAMILAVFKQRTPNMNPYCFLGNGLFLNGHLQVNPLIFNIAITGRLNNMQIFGALKNKLLAAGYSENEVNSMYNSVIKNTKNLPNNLYGAMFKIQIPYIERAPVYFNLFKKFKKNAHGFVENPDLYTTIYPADRKKINVVLSSALNIKKSNGDHVSRLNSKALLSYNYFGTFLFAANSVFSNDVGTGDDGKIINPQRILMPTFLGGGAYGNKYEDILNALFSPENAFIAALSGLHVIVNPGSHVFNAQENNKIDFFRSCLMGWNEAFKKYRAM
ncbi:MAG: hypothetical protein LBI55_01475 [Oscillospiraceae bacterium]|jgi:hypothetical protein|nr:hypothetical protein [Oscillospiraceae bacterium]